LSSWQWENLSLTFLRLLSITMKNLGIIKKWLYFNVGFMLNSRNRRGEDWKVKLILMSWM